MLALHGEDIEADFQHFYNVDIREITEPSLTWRRFRVLMERLPDGAHTRYAMENVPYDERGWTMDKHLLAGLIDRVGMTNYLLGAELVALGAFGKNGKNPIEEPKPIPRPGVVQKDARRGKGMKSLIRALGAPV